MMTLEKVEQFNRELGAGIETMNNYDQRIAQIRMYIAMAEANKDSEKALQAAKSLTDAVAERQIALDVLLNKTGASSYEAFRRYVVDLGIKIEASAKMLEVERRMRVQHELQATAGKFESPEQRSELETKIAEAAQLFETQLSLAASMIPNKPVLISELGGASI